MKINLKILLLFTILILRLCGFSQYHKSTWQPYGVNFEHITLEDGLSQSSVNVIFQDSYGFIWFGTQDGLNKYDGYNFTIYSPINNDTTSISDNQIWAIAEDNNKDLWIGTYGGLNKFDRDKDCFIRYLHLENNTNSISNNQIRSLFFDKEKQLWIGTKNGLDVLDIENDLFKHFFHDPKDENSLSGNYVRGFCYDHYKRLWIITDKNGINIYNENENNFTRINDLTDTRTIIEDKDRNIWVGTNINGLYKIKINDLQSNTITKIEDYPVNNVLSILQDNQGIIWTTGTEGLVRFDVFKNEFVKYKVDVNNNKSLNDNYIWTIIEDYNGILWLGTFAGGICKYDRSKNKFAHYQIKTKEEKLIESNFTRSFTSDYHGKIWVGSKGGLFKFEFNEKRNIYEQVEINTLNKLKDNYIRSIVTDSIGNIWIATNSAGLAYLDLSKQNLKYVFFNYNGDDKSLPSNNLRTLQIDNYGNIWVGTIDAGFCKLSKENDKVLFENFNKNNFPQLTDNYIRDIYQDSNDIFWIGTENHGLFRFDYSEKKFKNYSYDEHSNSISSNTITTIYQDSNGSLWIGTYGGGLNKFNKKDETFISLNKENGFPNNVIYGILEDENKNLWVSSNLGLTKINIENFKTYNYKIWDGLQSNEFNTGAYYKKPDGEMIFGGINGFNIFNPEKIIPNQYESQIIITDFKIFNKSISPKDSIQIIDKSISYIDKIELNYDQNVITIEFSALHFSNPTENQFMYKMDGIDKNWTTIKKNYATYTHLPPGKYTFIVKSSNCDEIWSNKEKKLNIIIKPPFWKTPIFKISIILLAILLVIIIFFVRTSVLKRQKFELEKKVLLRTYEINKQKTKILSINQELEQRNEEILAQSEILEEKNIELHKLSLVASKTNNSIMIMNEKAEIEWVNEGFTKLYGLTFQQLIHEYNRSMIKLSVKDDIELIIERCSKLNQVINYESFVRTPNNEKIWVQTTLSPITNNENEVIKIIAIESDITNQKKAEHEILLRNEEIRAQKEALVLQNEEIKTHKELLQKINKQLEIQNESIKGSHRTALTIQQAILPQEEYINQYFDCFILFKPKDIVSGDFYWFLHFNANNGMTEKNFIAVADCTGHGVPGAFMSMIGSRMLNEIIKEKNIFKPSDILEKLNSEIIKALKNNGQDGMDICLCYIETIDNNNKKFIFSGARRNLIKYNSSTKDIEIFKGSRKSIGGTFSNVQNDFIDYEVDIIKNDIFYLFSDGYIDQIGTSRRKFGTKRLLKTFHEISNKSMNEQKDILENILIDWQGYELQRDDITILGLKMI